MMLNGTAYQLPPLALRIAATASGSSPIPTPTAGDFKSTANATAGRSEGSEHHSGVTLTDFVRMWPTPNVAGGGNPPDRLKRHGNHFVRPSGKKAHLSLDQAVKLWPSPTARDTKGRDANCREGGPSLPEALYRTSGSGKLNPTWVEWLMGYPSGWTDLGVSETP
jgi:DNA (cytosine-5)-methyltransferase 1